MPSNKHSSGSKHPSSRHRHNDLMSNRTFSYYPAEKMINFYSWTSPPGVMKIISIIIIIMCVAVFACVASTLAWDYDMSLMGMGGGASMIPGYSGSYYGSSSMGGSSGSYGYDSGYGMQVNPVAGKGFMIAMAAITFIAVLIIFVLVISRQRTARSPTFYLATIIICAVLAFLVIIATIVYLVAVNPMAQTSGSMYYNQIIQLCSQYQTQSQAQGIFLNQYLYHYCVVEPQEAIAAVLGFLICIGLIILLVFAVRTRNKIRHWGPDRILWEEVKVFNVGHTSVGEWVNNVSAGPDILVKDHNTTVGGSRDYLNQLDSNRPIYLPGDSEISSSMGALKAKTWTKDYDTGAESGDDLEEEDFSALFPSILDEQERLHYKQEFDRNHREYKDLQLELDNINQNLAELDRELERYPEGSPQYLDALNEYNRLKNIKMSTDYRSKRRRSKYLRSKLSHIKRKVSEYDRRP